jgi:hypothetical protein
VSVKPGAFGGLVAGICALALIACGGDSRDGGTFDQPGLPFTFEYPDGFGVADTLSVDQQLGAAAAAQGAVGLDDDNVILAQLFTLTITIDESNLQVARREIGGLLAQINASPDLRESKVAGLPALTAEDVAVPSVDEGTSDLTFIFDGDQEYLINCQSTPDHRSEVGEACDLALTSFELK